MARLTTATDNAEILSYALRHLEQERDSILAKIAHIKQQLGVEARPVGRPKKVAAPAAAAETETGKKSRVLSPAARKRISLAQKKRWAASRGDKA